MFDIIIDLIEIVLIVYYLMGGVWVWLEDY